MSKHQIKARIQTQKVIDRALENAPLWTGNSKYYSERAIFNLLLFSALENTSVEDSCDYLNKKYETAIPSQDTVMRVIDRFYRSMTTGEIENTIANNLQKVAKLFPHFKHRRSKVIIAIDLHDEEYFGKNIFDNGGNQITMYGQKTDKTGKNRMVFRYGTLSIVAWGKTLAKPITLGFAVNHKGQPREAVVEILMKQIKDLDLRIKYLVIDGGFASREVFQYLSGSFVPYIARGRFSKKKQYPGGFDEPGFPYNMYRSGKPDYWVFGYLTKSKLPNGKDMNILYLSSKNANHRIIKRIYEKRFRIENTYRHARSVKIRTSTRKPHLRWVFWGISMLIELLWEIIRYSHGISKIPTYQSRQKMVNRQFHDFIMELLASARFRIN